VTTNTLTLKKHQKSVSVITANVFTLCFLRQFGIDSINSYFCATLVIIRSYNWRKKTVRGMAVVAKCPASDKQKENVLNTHSLFLFYIACKTT
jgi:hypothetical protein